MAGLHELIPGLAQAERDFQALQIEGFLGVEAPIAEVDVLPFTPRMFLELDYAGNDCLLGVRDPNPIHVEQFLWRISERFDRSASDPKKPGSPRRAVIAALASHPYIETVDQIHAYVKTAWTSEPMPFVVRTGKKRRAAPKSAGTWVSSIVDAIASEYGWTEAEILDLPFRRLFQYVNRILERAIPEYSQPCPEVLRLRDELLKALNRKKT